MKNFEYEMVDCPECGGTGLLNTPEASYSEFPDECICDCGKCDGKGEILSDYIIVTDPKVAVEFLGKEVHIQHHSGEGGNMGCNHEVIKSLIDKKGYIKIHKSVVKEVCEPKEGDAVFCFYAGDEMEDYYPAYLQYSKFTDYNRVIKANALPIGKTIGELEELIGWYKE